MIHNATNEISQWISHVARGSNDRFIGSRTRAQLSNRSIVRVLLIEHLMKPKTANKRRAKRYRSSVSVTHVIDMFLTESE